ncbi:MULTISPECIES: hypothetical protein [unclassified Thioalkalivibrio]|uniref:hypothetical protein n=1 Tax=unclassified Thioalkalivibrio TaxID=2621013 RepID=UPI00056DBB59|nr:MULTISPECIES: hypothetical protein [unclassified Thioalkalivibrio]
MMARSSDIFGTLGLWPLRAAPARPAPGAFERRCLWLGGSVGMRSVLTFASRMEPLAEGFSGREKALDV